MALHLVDEIRPNTCGPLAANKIGNAIDLTAVAGGTASANILSPEVSSPDGGPAYITLALGLDNDQEAVTDNLDIWGELTYGAGGFSSKVVFDWRNGTQVSIPANNAKLVANLTDLGGSSAGTYRLTAAAALNSNRPASAFQPARRSFLFEVAAGATSARIRAPNMASTVSILPVNSGFNVPNINIFGDFNSVLASRGLNVPGSTSPQEFPTQCRFFSFNNNDIVTAQFYAVFGLSL